jgi:pSer/pThr/pTyr-binding forkhead associated (FHA) protein
VSEEKRPFDADSTVVRDHTVMAGVRGEGREPRLELVRGPSAPRSFAIVGDEVVLGRSHQASVCIESGLLSRRHAAVRRNGPEFVLADLGSANGVFVNGVRVHSVVLCEGDTIQIGDVVLVFREGGG